MPRGVPSDKTRRNQVLARAREYLGHDIVLPDETLSSQMAEAQAVVSYVQDSGVDWREKVCSSCHKPFRFKWDREAIGYCSVPCMAEAARAIGLTWDPTRPPESRWGKTIPLVVSGHALEALSHSDDDSKVQVAPPVDTSILSDLGLID